jgi:hypothetical protein
MYSTCPILISPSCKRETAIEHVRVLQALVDACDSRVSFLNGRLWSISSDGESRRGKALAALTLLNPLPESSPLAQFMEGLDSFNYYCGKNGLTQDKDPKHIIKRMRYALIRPRGIVIDGFVLTSSILRLHLLDGGLSVSRVTELLDPSDKRDCRAPSPSRPRADDVQPYLP